MLRIATWRTELTSEYGVLRDKPVRLPCPWDSPGKNTGVVSHSLLQVVFPTQGLNPGLLHCRRILYHLSHQGRLGISPHQQVWNFSQSSFSWVAVNERVTAWARGPKGYCLELKEGPLWLYISLRDCTYTRILEELLGPLPGSRTQ